MLIVVFLCPSFVYPDNVSHLRVLPMSTTKEGEERLRKTLGQLNGIRHDKQGYSNEKEEYLVHLKGDFPKYLARHSLDWPVDMVLDGYIWHFYESLYRPGNYSLTHHRGIDILFIKDEDIKIKAVLDGEIIYIYNFGERTYSILVRSENGLVCCYSHIAADEKFIEGSIYYKPLWEIGQKIKKGQLVGKIAWWPRSLKDYEELDSEKKLLPFDGITLATHLHFQTWYFPPEMPQNEVTKHIRRGVLGETSENEFNPLLILKPLYLISLLQESPVQSNIASMGAIIKSSSTARTCQ